MATVNTDRNLLFSILALQMDFISRDALIAAMSAWAVAKSKHIGRILVEQDALTESRYAMLDALVEEHLKLHGNDPQRSLAAVSGIGSVRQDLEQIADADLHASLAHVPAVCAEQDADATRPPSMGVPTSTGLRFRVVRPHAKGGLGVVSVARDEELHREVALKEIQGEHADNAQSRARFVLEAEITGGLEHPGIVPVYGLGHDPTGRPFYAMRFIRGNSLREAIERFHQAEKPGRDPGERALALRELLGRFVDVCNAIAYAHSRSVLHRDLKPGNIMLGQYGETLVVDWGLAKPLDRSEEAAQSEEGPLKPASGSGVAPTQMGSAIGTPQYMSPEQAAGRLDRLGPGSDVYSLGATLYCLLTCRAPFDDPDVGMVLQKVQQGNFPPPRSVKGQVAPALEAICLKAMALKPEDRYETPHALADDLEHWLADEPVSAYREPWQKRAGRWARRHKTLVAATTAGLLVALLAGGVSVWWLEKQRVEQRARQHENDQKVLLALERARSLLDEGWQAHNLVKLKAAQVEAERAVLIAHNGAAATAVQQEATAVQQEVETQIARAEKNRDLLRDLLEIFAPHETRSYQSNAPRLAMAVLERSVEEQYVAAFHRRWADLDIDKTEEAVVVARLGAEPPPVVEEIMAGLDSWMLERRQQKQPEPNWQRLVRVADRLDRNDQRRQLRTLLAGEGQPPMEIRKRVIKAMATSGSTHWFEGVPRFGAALWEELEQKQRLQRLTQLRKKMSPAHEPVLSVVLLARMCQVEGDAVGAENVLRQAWTARPNEVVLLHALAKLQEERGRLAEAIEWYQVARTLRPELGIALGLALSEAGRAEEAEAVLRDLSEKQPLSPEILVCLAVVLRDYRKKPAEAEAICRKAIVVQPSCSQAHYNLGEALYDQKKLAETVAAFRTAHELLPNQSRYRDRLHQGERMLQLDQKLAAYLSGKERPATPQEAAELGDCAAYRERYRAAVRFYTNAFHQEPDLAKELHGLHRPASHRYTAACCAVMAAAGAGKDAGLLSESERASFCRQALNWLRDDLYKFRLMMLACQVAKDTPLLHVLQQGVANWLDDTDLESVRDAAAQAKLPDTERDAWRKLWADVEALSKRAAEK